MHDTDTPQIAYLRDLEEKRNAAFKRAMTTDELIAAYRAVGEPRWSRATRPIRTNEPLAGDACYEPHSPAPVAWYDRVDWPDVLGTICGVLIVVAIAGACCYAFLRATQGWAR